MAKKRTDEPPTCEGYVSEENVRKYLGPLADDRELGEPRKKPRRRPTSRRTRRGRKT